MIVYICTPQAVAGLLADARSLADVAREEASSFRSNYGHDIPLKVSPNLSHPTGPPPLSVSDFKRRVGHPSPVDGSLIDQLIVVVV